jgi:hypothetical protein
VCPCCWCCCAADATAAVAAIIDALLTLLLLLLPLLLLLLVRLRCPCRCWSWGGGLQVARWVVREASAAPHWGGGGAAAVSMVLGGWVPQAGVGLSSCSCCFPGQRAHELVRAAALSTAVCPCCRCCCGRHSSSIGA